MNSYSVDIFNIKVTKNRAQIQLSIAQTVKMGLTTHCCVEWLDYGSNLGSVKKVKLSRYRPGQALGVPRC
jgi:hypothetical protein